MRVLVLGAGSFAREVADLLADQGDEAAAFAVNVHPWRAGMVACHRAVYWWEDLPDDLDAFVAGFVSPERDRFASWLEDRGWLGQIVLHPSASVSRRAFLWPGAVVSRLVAVGRDADVKPHAILNRGCTVGHDCSVGRCATVGPGANLAGGVVLGPRATVGMGACVLEGRRVGEGAVVGAGAVVTRDVPDGETWLGVPARRVR